MLITLRPERVKVQQSCCFLKTGEHHLYTTDGFEQEVSIERLFKHPKYNTSSVHNYDLALLKLNETLQFNVRVRPVCLPESEFASGTKCFVTGWGTTENSAKRRPKVFNTPQNAGCFAILV